MRVVVLVLLAAGGCCSFHQETGVPAGRLGFALGTYLTVEGETAAPAAKVNPRTLIVDTVNGERLDRPVSVIIENPEVELPPAGRVIIRGYETGKMIGTPDAEIQAAAEAGRDAHVGQAAFQFYRTFVLLSWVEPVK
ncbi:MAG: hypothetical protein MUE73_22115 [Planctomycetes bacterium]|nr:hypothetical protein [Planctomycetota bacterium]